MADTGVLLIDDPRCMGSEERKELERQIMDHETPYRYGNVESGLQLRWQGGFA